VNQDDPLSAEALEITDIRATLAVLTREVQRIRDLLAKIEARKPHRVGGTFWANTLEGD
jgi:hypothetical protein